MIIFAKIQRFLDKYIKKKSKYIIIKRSKYNNLMSDYRYAIVYGSAYMKKCITLHREIKLKDVEIKFLKQKLKEESSKRKEPNDFRIIEKKDKRGKTIYYREMISTGKLSRVSAEEAMKYLNK